MSKKPAAMSIIVDRLSQLLSEQGYAEAGSRVLHFLACRASEGHIVFQAFVDAIEPLSIPKDQHVPLLLDIIQYLKGAEARLLDERFEFFIDDDSAMELDRAALSFALKERINPHSLAPDEEIEKRIFPYYRVHENAKVALLAWAKSGKRR